MLTKAALGAAIEAARIKKGVTKQELAQQFGVKPPSVQDWVKKGSIEKDRLLALFQYFSDVVGPDHWGLAYWPNAQHASAGSSVFQAQELSHPISYAGLSSTERVPVTGTLEMADEEQMKLIRPRGGKAIGSVDAPAGAPGGYAVRVVGDWLYPTARHGACLVVEPHGQCVAGELVLVFRANGVVEVCELVAARTDSVTLVPANGGQRLTLARSEVESIHAIVAVVAASKFRPAAQPLPQLPPP
jgi:Peptidase S24-like/Helix-turn-helix